MAAKDDNNKDANNDKSETCNMVPLSSTTHRFCSSLDTIFFIPAWCPCSSQDFSNWFPSCFQIIIDASQSVSDMWRRGGQKSGKATRKDKCLDIWYTCIDDMLCTYNMRIFVERER